MVPNTCARWFSIWANSDYTVPIGCLKEGVSPRYLKERFFFYHKGLKLKCPCFNNLCGWRLVVGSWNLEGLIYTFETTREGILDLKLSRRFGAGPRGKSERKWNPTKAYKKQQNVMQVHWTFVVESLRMILGPSSQSLRHVYQKEASRKTGKQGELLQISVAFFDVSHWLGWVRKTSLMASGSTTSPLPWAKAKPEGTKWSLEIQQLDRCNWELVHGFVSMFSYGAWCAWEPSCSFCKAEVLVPVGLC